MHLDHRVILLFFLFLLATHFVSAQEYSSLTEVAFDRSPGSLQDKITVSSAGFSTNYSLLEAVPQSVLIFYQKVLSSQFSADCIYTESCSAFARSAVTHFGIAKGLMLAIDRLTRCTPLVYWDEGSYSKFGNGRRIIDHHGHYAKPAR